MRRLLLSALIPVGLMAGAALSGPAFAAPIRGGDMHAPPPSGIHRADYDWHHHHWHHRHWDHRHHRWEYYD